MTTPFARTLRAVDADGARLRVGGVAAAIGVAWLAWMAFAEITVWETTGSARVEVSREAQSVEAGVGGRVTRVAVALDQEVAEGDVLVELDGQDLALRVEETTTRQAAAARREEALLAAQAAAEAALGQAEATAAAAGDEARAHLREAESAATLADAQRARTEKLHASGGVSDEALESAQQVAAQRAAAVEAARTAVERLALQARQDESERRAAVEELRQQVAEVAGDRAAATSALARLAWEMDRTRLRAPVAGRVGELVPLYVGGLVSAGARVGAIVPDGELRVVAFFTPEAALGRVAPGQAARVRLDGFPWTRFGSLGATVTRVAREPRDGQVRVELAVTADPASAIPVQHGLTGTVEVAVEEASPLALALRAAGDLVRRAGPS